MSSNNQKNIDKKNQTKTKKEVNGFFDLELSDSEILKMIHEMKKAHLFPELSMDIYKQNANTLWKIYKDNTACLKSKSKICTNENGYHLWFAPLHKNKIVVTQQICEKHKASVSKTNFIKNYVLRSFDDKLLDLKMTSTVFDKTYDKSREALTKHVIDTVKDYSSDKNYYIYGQTGVGKSYLTILLCNQLAAGLSNLKKGIELSPKTIAYTSMPEVITSFAKAFSKYESIDSELDKLCNADVLVLDDLGSETVRDWFFKDYLIKIVNSRNEKDKLTIFISNFSIPKLREYYITRSHNELDYKTVDKFISRIHGLVGNNVFCLDGKDWRLKDLDLKKTNS